MTKTQKKHHRQGARNERKKSTEKPVAQPRVSRLKELSKKLLHNYVIPMTRIIEHRLQRLEQAL